VVLRDWEVPLEPRTGPLPDGPRRIHDPPPERPPHRRVPGAAGVLRRPSAGTVMALGAGRPRPHRRLPQPEGLPGRPRPVARRPPPGRGPGPRHPRNHDLYEHPAARSRRRWSGPECASSAATPPSSARDGGGRDRRHRLSELVEAVPRGSGRGRGSRGGPADPRGPHPLRVPAGRRRPASRWSSAGTPTAGRCGSRGSGPSSSRPATAGGTRWAVPRGGAYSTSIPASAAAAAAGVVPAGDHEDRAEKRDGRPAIDPPAEGGGRSLVADSSIAQNGTCHWSVPHVLGDLQAAPGRPGAL